MEGDFLNSLYWEEWYNNGDMLDVFPCPEYPDQSNGIYILSLKYQLIG